MPLGCSNSFVFLRGACARGFIDTERTSLFHSQCCQELLDPRCLPFSGKLTLTLFTSHRVRNHLAPPIFAIPKGLVSVLRPAVIFMGVPLGQIKLKLSQVSNMVSEGKKMTLCSVKILCQVNILHYAIKWYT